MIKHLNKRKQPLHKFCKRYEVDIWGKLTTLKRNNKISRFFYKLFSDEKIKNKKINSQQKNKVYRKFVYRIDIIDPKRKKRKVTAHRSLFFLKRKLLKYYNNIKKHQLKNYTYRTLRFKKANSQMNMGIDSFISLIEHRLDILLLRSNFCFSIKHARQLITHKHVVVNNKIINKSNFIVKNFSLISLNLKIKKNFLKILKTKIKTKKILMYPPEYISVNYKLGLAMIIKNPTYNKVPFPFKVDYSLFFGLAKYS